MLVNCVHQNDPSRPVTSAMTTWDDDWEIFDPLFAVHDIGGYNYQLHRAPSDHAASTFTDYCSNRIVSQRCFRELENGAETITIYSEILFGRRLIILGESGIGRWYYPGDIPGEHWEGALFPWHGAYCGDIDLTGWRKPISHYRSMLYNNTEKLYMAVREPSPESGKIKQTLWSVWPTWESWTWPGLRREKIYKLKCIPNIQRSGFT